MLADPPRWPIEFARKLGVQASSRPYRLVRGVAVNDPETPEHAHQVNVRLDVDLPLLPSEAAEVVPEYPRCHRRDHRVEAAALEDTSSDSRPGPRRRGWCQVASTAARSAAPNEPHPGPGRDRRRSAGKPARTRAVRSPAAGVARPGRRARNHAAATAVEALVELGEASDQVRILARPAVEAAERPGVRPAGVPAAGGLGEAARGRRRALEPRGAVGGRAVHPPKPVVRLAGGCPG